MVASPGFARLALLQPGRPITFLHVKVSSRAHGQEGGGFQDLGSF